MQAPYVYVYLSVTLGDGTVTATFTSFSPVVILVAQDGTPTGASVTAGTTSPKAVETSMIYAVEALALLSAFGFVICRKRARR